VWRKKEQKHQDLLTVGQDPVPKVRTKVCHKLLAFSLQQFLQAFSSEELVAVLHLSGPYTYLRRKYRFV